VLKKHNMRHVILPFPYGATWKDKNIVKYEEGSLEKALSMLSSRKVKQINR
jgi:hypothetical protein